MCLSTAYELHGDEKSFVCKNVMLVKPESGKVVLTDLMGAQTEVAGTVKSIDLIANEILIEAV